jgi:hypothetical protein
MSAIARAVLAQGVVGAKGFDANARISRAAAIAFANHGFSFAVRYVRRAQPNAQDLGADEIDDLLAAGLGIMCVQHVESESSWVPSKENGVAFGAAAALELEQLGVGAGAIVWCDLEGVSTAVSAIDVIAYASAWHDAVANAGYLPGLYVGWHCGLSAESLYHDLPFERYWAAYNLNADQQPAVRGVCMRQHLRTPADVPPGCQVDFDVNIVQLDAHGDLPVLITPGAAA